MSDWRWETAGAHRVHHGEQDDAEVVRHQAHLRAAAAIGTRDRVLDIGCGTGQSTRDAASAAVEGRVVGIDLSAPMLERARELTAASGMSTVEFVRADAQHHEFPPASFDVAISRFGSMFFADPVAAFTTIARALRPAGRLVLLVWQPRERNEWSTAVSDALVGDPLPHLDGADPFSLGDPATVHTVLSNAGFAEVELIDVDEPVNYGRDADQAVSFVRGFRSTGQLLRGQDERAALARLRAMLATHETAEGVLLDSRAWIVTARRR